MQFVIVQQSFTTYVSWRIYFIFLLFSTRLPFFISCIICILHIMFQMLKTYYVLFYISTQFFYQCFFTIAFFLVYFAGCYFFSCDVIMCNKLVQFACCIFGKNPEGYCCNFSFQRFLFFISFSYSSFSLFFECGVYIKLLAQEKAE